uniref:Cytochrome P450-like protein n=1 Tax=Oryza sativa subsp. japonica TaxID=39947 RepID=Q8GVK1_ORYSJ|nr:cytochrome P450-like protein [Oryza sativa Japonica Group]BAD31670.1 cytochrome P450-like protein [Oryza sativa Japonica Group]
MIRLRERRRGGRAGQAESCAAVRLARRHAGLRGPPAWVSSHTHGAAHRQLSAIVARASPPFSHIPAAAAALHPAAVSALLAVGGGGWVRIPSVAWRGPHLVGGGGFASCRGDESASRRGLDSACGHGDAVSSLPPPRPPSCHLTLFSGAPTPAYYLLAPLLLAVGCVG